jgi:hypothetical protein
MTPNRAESNARFLAFARLWALAAVAHVIGNFGQPDPPRLVGWANLLTGLVGVLLLFAPESRFLLVLAALTVASVILEMPVTGNHWVIAGLVSAVILVAAGNERRIFPAARWVLVVFYAFAAFAKLNSGFFDPSVSCAVFYANQGLASWGLPMIASNSLPAVGAIWLSAAIELSVVPLLAFRRTRYFGVIVGSTFHTLISFDFDQHFYDFTSIMLPLFALFLPASAFDSLAQAIGRFPSTFRRIGMILIVVVLVVLVVLASLPQTALSLRILTSVPFVLWIPFALWWLAWLVRSRVPAPAVSWRLDWATGGIVALAIVNGLTPYMELKTAYGFNMYSNLQTAQGVSNHFFFSRTMRLRDGYREPVEVLDSSDPGLLLYRDRRYLIAYPQFQRYLAGQSTTVEFRRGDQEYSLSGHELDPGPWWWRFMPLRALDSQQPPRCQNAFLPAL